LVADTNVPLPPVKPRPSQVAIGGLHACSYQAQRNFFVSLR
jgi:hypothetical protein